jgi:hypothetical protein
MKAGGSDKPLAIKKSQSPISKKTKTKASVKIQRKKKQSQKFTDLSKNNIVFDPKIIQEKLEQISQQQGYPENAFSKEGKEAIQKVVMKFMEMLIQKSLQVKRIRTGVVDNVLSAKDLEITLSVSYPELLAI